MLRPFSGLPDNSGLLAEGTGIAWTRHPATAMDCSLAMLITVIQVVVSCRCNSLDFSASIERNSTAFRNTPRRSADRGFRSRPATVPRSYP
jgi:hypothetical protein